MGRNRNDSRWVAANSDHPYTHKRPGPERTTKFVPQPNHHVSQIPSLLKHADGNGRYSYEDEDVSPRTRTHFAPHGQHASISPHFPSHINRRDSPVSPLEPIAFSHSEEARKGSEATVFPYFPHTIKKPEPKAKSSWRNHGHNAGSQSTPYKSASKRQIVNQIQDNEHDTNWFKIARDIYKTGPRGEGQKVWKAYQQFRKEKHLYTDANEPISSKSSPPDPDPQSYRRPSATGLSAHPPPPNKPLPHPPQKHSAPNHPGLRKYSDLSRTSYEVPLSLDTSIRQVIDVNKPLPPIPKLSAAPKPRRQVGHPHPSTTAHTEKLHVNEQPTVKHPQQPSWWKSLAPTLHTSPSPSTSTSTLKSKISRPQPLHSPTITAGINLEHAFTPLRPAPLPHGAPAVAELSERKKGKQKAKQVAHWRELLAHPADRFERRRKDSDVSFGCVGVGGLGLGMNVMKDGEGMRRGMRERRGRLCLGRCLRRGGARMGW